MKRLLSISLAILLALSLSIVLLSAPLVMAQSTIYVDDDAPNDPGPNDPTVSDPLEDGSAVHPFDQIQEGIDDALSGDTVQVASGTYYENITLKDSVQVLGAGADVTTIDGDRKGGVVFMAHNSILRGFRVTGGGLDWQIYIFRCAIQSVGKVNVEIAENTIEDNWSPLGASGSDLLFHHNLVVNNSGTVELHEVSSALIVNNIFANNGFALELNTSSASIINNTIVKNGNGIVLLSGSSPDIRNNIVAGNTYVGINNVPEPLGLPTLHHNNVWNNGTDYRNLSPSSGDISADPMFVDLTSGDYHLQAGSPCIDTGTNEGAPAEDIEGNPRPIDGDGDGTATTDMGAYEYVLPEVWVDDGWAGASPGDTVDGHTFGTDAFAKIQDGIDAVGGSIVHVAAGTYYENITLKDGVQVLGAGADITIIDGSTARAGQPAYHVVLGADNATLDGFTITGGNANGAGNDGKGGGMLNWSSSPTVTNCTFSGNSAWDDGGGMLNWESSPIVTNCTFSGNSAGWGGGMYNWESSPIVTNCTFSGNSASNGGGGMYNHDYSSATVTNCIFSSNSSGWGWGAGMHNHKSSPTVTNCTFSSNSGGGMLNWESSPAVTNCILWDNGYEISNDGTSTPLVTYSDIQGGYSGEGNISADPKFIDPASGDYHLQAGSPCIDAGTNEGAPAEDIEGNPRPVDGDRDGTAATDMGAYEYVPPATLDFDPDTLHLGSEGRSVTVYIELPLGYYHVAQIDVSSIKLNGEVGPLATPTEVGDYDSDGVPDLMVKFDRSDVQDVLEPGDEVEVMVSGRLTDGTPFEGADTIRVIE